MSRDWRAARAKVEWEGRCRILGGCEGPLDPAHIIQRSRIPSERAMAAENIVPLCRRHHRAYDAHRLDLLPHLNLEEQAYAASLVGLVAALARLTGGADPSPSQKLGPAPAVPHVRF